MNLTEQSIREAQQVIAESKKLLSVRLNVSSNYLNTFNYTKNIELVELTEKKVAS